MNLNNMGLTVADLNKGERGVIIDCSSEGIPLKLLEMGCLPGNEVKVLFLSPLLHTLFLNVNGSLLAIRKDTAKLILINKKSKNKKSEKTPFWFKTIFALIFAFTSISFKAPSILMRLLISYAFIEIGIQLSKRIYLYLNNISNE